MAVQPDSGVKAGNVLSWSHVCNGTSRYLLVTLHIGSSTITGSAITYAGAGMTFLGRSTQAAIPATTELWGLVAPATGSNTVSVTLSGANPGCANGSTSYSGVDQSTPTDGSPQGTTGSASTPASAAKTGVADMDMLVAAADSSVALTASGASTDLESGSGANTAYLLADGTSQTVTWSGSGNWSCEVVLLKGDTAIGGPSVASTDTSATTTAGTSHTVNLPLGVQAGDLLIVCLDKGSTAATVNALAGWTELLDENSANGLYIAYRWADGTEGATITLTTSASTRSAENVYRIINAVNPATQPPEIGTTASGTSVSPDPPAVTPTGGAKDYLAIAMLGDAGEFADTAAWLTAAPSGYSGPLRKTCGTVGTNLGGIIGSAYKKFNAASEDPGVFTQTSAAWRTQTIIVHPAPVTTTPVIEPTRALQAVNRGSTY